LGLSMEGAKYGRSYAQSDWGCSLYTSGVRVRVIVRMRVRMRMRMRVRVNGEPQPSLFPPTFLSLSSFGFADYNICLQSILHGRRDLCLLDVRRSGTGAPTRRQDPFYADQRAKAAWPHLSLRGRPSFTMAAVGRATVSTGALTGAAQMAVVGYHRQLPPRAVGTSASQARLLAASQGAWQPPGSNPATLLPSHHTAMC